ncbi:hypothetical protein PTTG_26061 [Puccinia triticina 1-1 BBBD Race 1]|uniref:DUF1640 domain-containing protein n=2 Tax=Puccinia triticina TaxID=208348 RepID=A0A180GXI7_PUCT1|nr:uncharacterized protein PtA15_9A598 [Puccinia triticina]OAV97460.1 hypothetical protein PTTG_26061 [Puccinia triticina 1-1 BBBD Race 1]WAQ88471.1 hypothetical protein PtA15_9A598 [Puccinia triticina]WAR60648.1 hypothetical protein PtB15_9B587 [Puccinia triticina]
MRALHLPQAPGLIHPKWKLCWKSTSFVSQQQSTQRVDFAKLKSEILQVEKQDYALLKSENERLISELEKLKQRSREETTRTQASVQLDLNLEKGRIRDELGVRELKLREVDTRIEGEIGNLRTTMESAKFNILQYVVVTVASGGALLIAYIRMSVPSLAIFPVSRP